MLFFFRSFHSSSICYVLISFNRLPTKFVEIGKNQLLTLRLSPFNAILEIEWVKAKKKTTHTKPFMLIFFSHSFDAFKHIYTKTWTSFSRAFAPHKQLLNQRGSPQCKNKTLNTPSFSILPVAFSLTQSLIHSLYLFATRTNAHKTTVELNEALHIFNWCFV